MKDNIIILIVVVVIIGMVLLSQGGGINILKDVSNLDKSNKCKSVGGTWIPATNCGLGGCSGEYCICPSDTSKWVERDVEKSKAEWDALLDEYMDERGNVPNDLLAPDSIDVCSIERGYLPCMVKDDMFKSGCII